LDINVICDKRKEKGCPAEWYICPACCGEKRGIEINCPRLSTLFSCRNIINKVSRQRLRKEGVGSFIRRAELYNTNPMIFSDIEIAFVRVLL
jgi:hypothetical protein